MCVCVFVCGCVCWFSNLIPLWDGFISDQCVPVPCSRSWVHVLAKSYQRPSK